MIETVKNLETSCKEVLKLLKEKEFEKLITDGDIEGLSAKRRRLEKTVAELEAGEGLVKEKIRAREQRVLDEIQADRKEAKFLKAELETQKAEMTSATITLKAEVEKYQREQKKSQTARDEANDIVKEYKAKLSNLQKTLQAV